MVSKVYNRKSLLETRGKQILETYAHAAKTISWSRHAVPAAITTATSMQHRAMTTTTVGLSSMRERIPTGTRSRADDTTVSSTRTISRTLASS